MAKNLTGLSNSIKNLKYKAKKKGINVDKIVPRGYNKLTDEEKFEIVQNLQEKIYGKNSLNNKKHEIKNKPKKSKGLTKIEKLLSDKTGVKDIDWIKSQANDIKEYVHKVNKIKEDTGLLPYLEHYLKKEKVRHKTEMRDLYNLIKTDFKDTEDYINKTPKKILWLGLRDVINSIDNSFNNSTMIQDIVNNVITSEKVRDQIIKKYEKLPLKIKLSANIRLAEIFYEKYHATGEDADTLGDAGLRKLIYSTFKEL